MYSSETRIKPASLTNKMLEPVYISFFFFFSMKIVYQEKSLLYLKSCFGSYQNIPHLHIYIYMFIF